MGKLTKVAILLLSLLFLFSCASTEKSEESEASATEERRKDAVALLSFDMFSSVEDWEMDTSVLSSSLPSSFTVYSDYVPSYGELELKYVSSISRISEEAVRTSLPLLATYASSLIDEPEKYISDDDSFTSELKNISLEEVEVIVLSALKEHSSEINDSFLQVKRVFDEIRTAYANLSKVEKGVALPEASGMDFNVAAHLVSESFFNDLGSLERTLKNTPASSDSLYAVFWE